VPPAVAFWPDLLGQKGGGAACDQGAEGGGGHFGGGKRFCSMKEDAMNRLIRALVAPMPTVDRRKFFAGSYTDIKRRTDRVHCADQQRICSLGEGSGSFLRSV
jgi:hypothetical protein